MFVHKKERSENKMELEIQGERGMWGQKKKIIRVSVCAT
jgi:hypothetical protein